MEDWEEQEVEFWRKLEEEEFSRASMLRRSAAAAVGLTVLAAPATAFGGRVKLGANPPLKGKGFSKKELVAQAKKEGHLNVIALPPDWANYGEILDTFKKKYGLAITSDNPNGNSAQENQAIVSLKGDPRAPDAVDVGPQFAVSGAAQGLYGRYFVSTFATIPRSMKDTRGYWWGDYWGATSIAFNANIVKPAPTSYKDLLNSAYKGKVAVNGSPLSASAASSQVLAASIANGGSLNDIGPGIDFFAQLKKSGNYISVDPTPQTVASGQTPIVLDWDYLNIAYRKEFPAVNWTTVIPKDGVVGNYYCQAINATAPHPWAARLWQEFLFSDQGQLLWLKGYSHPARFQDLAKRKVVPSSLLKALPPASDYAKAKFPSIAQIKAGSAKLAAEWTSKVGA
jgi:putative spermidine/putrescine transport system substrate-binding protein